MEIRISSRQGDVSETLRQYIEKKLVKFDRFLPNAQSIAVDMSTQATKSQGELNVAQATMRLDREVLRAEVKAPDAFEAVDQMLAKLQRQVERYKGKRQDRWRGRGAPVVGDAAVAALAEEELEDEEMPVVRRKRFAVYPMSETEAVEQMELLGHDFYLYQNATSGRVNLVYRRKGGGYGVLEPEVA